MQIIKKREEDKYTGERRIATLLPKHSDHTSPYLKKKKTSMDTVPENKSPKNYYRLKITKFHFDPKEAT